MIDHIANRIRVVDTLREELFGPVSPLQAAHQQHVRVVAREGIRVRCEGAVSFDKAEDAYGPFVVAESGEEILLRDPPSKRYGVGVLYPAGNMSSALRSDPDLGDELPNLPSDAVALTAQDALRAISAGIGLAKDDGGDDFDISGANEYRQSCIGLSFLAQVEPSSRIDVELSGGLYHSKRVHVAGKERQWWLRKSTHSSVSFPSDAILGCSRKVLKEKVKLQPPSVIALEIQLLARMVEQGLYLITICIVNRTQCGRSFTHDSCLYQTFFAVKVASDCGNAKILPYRESACRDNFEETALRLLYRKKPTFAIGHGCAAGWLNENASNATSIFADCLPTCEIPNVTPDIFDSDGVDLAVSMSDLAGLNPESSGHEVLGKLMDEYAKWIRRQEEVISSLDEPLLQVASSHLDDCKCSLNRMRAGLKYLEDPLILRAFQLANHAVMLQQRQSRLPLREAEMDEDEDVIRFARPYSAPEVGEQLAGKWRAFQIAFLLMNLESAISGDSPERETVELIWFPTGGGKTEAYLGLSAFSLFARRLHNPSDAGVQVIMRYTLRLLTAQQFQRAASLICAMEILRRTDEKLGSTPFTIGIWVGGESTPNTRSSAKSALAKLQSDPRADNPFLILKCPWCAARMGPLESNSTTGAKTKKRKGYFSSRKANPAAGQGKIPVLGYEAQGGSVALCCPDPACCFVSQLPLQVVDEDIYEQPPSIVIGTVDKFAALAWLPEARAIFGIDPTGSRCCSPPGLIIQDELHLIGGPLGSLVGLFETVVEELCTDRRNGICRPKIIASTATICRYREQILALYGRDSVQLFPPPGLDEADSFFAVQVADQPGRMFVGVNAPGLGSMQTTQVRTFTALLQSSQSFSVEERDPWWTLLVFFNSLRELGTTVSLFQSDIPDYFRTYRFRRGLTDSRRVYEVKELTGRLRRDQVPKAIEDLEVTTMQAGRKAVDVCLASNIIEVGVDIPRLSLMTVVGQPKTTSQYIQVSGRVGRLSKERPGLVVTLYSASKPRDRSHFEKFKTYHQKLYAEVEPTSVTPFSYPCLERALHAVMVSYVRQTGAHSLPPSPVPSSSLGVLRELLDARLAKIDPGERDSFSGFFIRRLNEWATWERTKWTRKGTEAEPGLIRAAGQYAPTDHIRLSWSTPRSMRNVDAECQAEITTLYILEGES